MVETPASAWSSVDRHDEQDRLVSALDRLRAEPFYRQRKDRIRTLIGAPPGALVIDVGCGTGDDAAAMIDEHRVIAFDLSRHMLRQARHRHPGLWVVQADASRLPLPTGRVATVRAERVLQHIPAYLDALREWRRVLPNGGRLITSDANYKSVLIEGVDPVLAARITAWNASTVAGAKAVPRLAELLRIAGFRNVELSTDRINYTSLAQADGIFGLAGWGSAAADAGWLAPDDARRWRAEVLAADATGTLLYSCDHVLAVAEC